MRQGVLREIDWDKIRSTDAADHLAPLIQSALYRTVEIVRTADAWAVARKAAIDGLAAGLTGPASDALVANLGKAEAELFAATRP